MFEPYPGSGVESIRMTDDAKYLATLSSAKTQVGLCQISHIKQLENICI